MLVGGGSLQKPAASKTGNNSRTRPGIEPSSMLDRDGDNERERERERYIECGG